MKDKHYLEYRNFGLSLAYFRKLKGMTQQQLAEKIDMSCETISRIENANIAPSFDTLFDLSKALDIPLGEIFTHAKI